MLIDTHAHIYMLENPEMAMMEARDNGIDEIIIPSASEDDFEAVCSREETIDSKSLVCFGDKIRSG